MVFRLPQSSGVPVYLQLMEQLRHAIETGALREGDQLPTIRKVAGDLVVNPNTVARAYRELEHLGILELRHGTGAFVKESPEGRRRVLRNAHALVRGAIERLASLELTDDELRRVLESEPALKPLTSGAAIREGRGGQSMTDHIIETNQLTKSFNGTSALRGLNLRVPKGSIFGFLGRNGAGKTTTIKTLMGLLRSDSGTAQVFGIQVTDADRSIEVRRRIGFVTEDKELYPYMTVEQIIRFTRPLFPKWRDDLEKRYLQMFELPPKRKIPDLSKGMRSKLMLLLAISRGAELLILDEPTDGLDPAATEDVLRELVDITASEGTTMFFSSHQLAEVEFIADHIGIIDQGKMIASGSLDEMKAQYQRLQIVFADSVRMPEHWVEGVENIRHSGRVVSILASHNVDAIVEQAQSLPGALQSKASPANAYRRFFWNM